jgi:hypothetical protein
MLDAVHVERQGRGLLLAGHVHARLRQLHDVVVDFDAQRRALELMVGVALGFREVRGPVAGERMHTGPQLLRRDDSCEDRAPGFVTRAR